MQVGRQGMEKGRRQGRGLLRKSGCGLAAYLLHAPSYRPIRHRCLKPQNASPLARGAWPGCWHDDGLAVLAVRREPSEADESVLYRY